MKRLAALAVLVGCTLLQAASDPKTVGKECYEKFRSSGSFEKIQECIDKALPQSKDQPVPPVAAAHVPPTPAVVPASNKSEPEPKGAMTAVATVEKFQASDPEQSHAGESCTYFTKRSVSSVDWDGNREMGAGRYTDGSVVAYGKWVYRCSSGRWEAVNPTWTYSASQLEGNWAQVIEGTGVAPKDPLP